MLYPHVIAAPDFSKTGGFGPHETPQYLYLNPKSPLVSDSNFRENYGIANLTYPPGFDMAKTPLVAFRRSDFLLDRDEVLDVFSKHNPSGNRSQVFGGDASTDITTKTYLDLFNSKLPEGGYRVLVVNTAGHWSPRTLKDLPGGMPALLKLFGDAMSKWMDDVIKAIPETSGKRVIARAYLPGHNGCFGFHKPLTQIQRDQGGLYNWDWMDRFNQLFESIIESHKLSHVNFLEIARPGRLRPDAHTTSDCLHFSVGTGVIEGWTEYIWDFLRRQS